MLTLKFGGFRYWLRWPFVQGLCLIAKEMEQGITITLFLFLYHKNRSPKTRFSIDLFFDFLKSTKPVLFYLTRKLLFRTQLKEIAFFGAHIF